MHRPSRLRWEMAALFGLLAITAVLLDPLARGIRFTSDDLNFYDQIWTLRNQSLWQQAFTRYGADGPTRSLAMWPFALTFATAWPVIAIQVFYIFSWILNAVAAYSIGAALRPHNRFLAFSTGILVMTATSDWHTTSIVYGPHLFGIALFLFGLAAALRALAPKASLGWLAAAAGLFLVSSFTVEYMYPVVPLLPAIYWIHSGSLRSRRLWLVSAGSFLAFAPGFTMLISYIRGPANHAANMLLSDATLSARLNNTLVHVWHNFLPWTWLFRPVPPWIDNFRSMYPIWVMLAAAAVVTGIVCFFIRQRDELHTPASTPVPWPRSIFLMLAFLACVVLANAGSERLGGDYFIRSHFVSRVFASLCIGVIASWLWQRGREVFSTLLLAVFIFFGAAGGLERQSFSLANSLRERAELTSLVTQVPKLRPGGTLLLIQPARSPTQLAVNNPNTLGLLYGDEKMGGNTRIAPNSTDAYSVVHATPEGLLRPIINSQPMPELDPAKVVILMYCMGQGRFFLLPTLPAGLLRAAKATPVYHPQDWIDPNAPTRPTLVENYLGLGARSWPMPRMKHDTPSLMASTSNRDLCVDDLTPFSIGKLDAGAVVWLGSGERDGFSLLVHAESAGKVTLSVPISPGWSRKDPRRTLQVRISDKSGRATNAQTHAFDQETKLSLSVPLGAGDNIVELWIAEPPDDPATREAIMARLLPMTLN